MTSALSALSSVLRIAGHRLGRALVAIPINLITLPLGIALFAVGSILDFVTPEAGSNARMSGLDTISWGWDWWPAEVDLEWDD